MSGDEIRLKAASEVQRGSRRGLEGWPTPLFRASWSTEFMIELELSIRIGDCCSYSSL